ncbi:Centrosomal protein [Oopsacas minuta]|uniref:Centrosomal protein n=1 Tax=Oopsacas minuta TaxID=111878 RepID=A0AAV7K8R0_9METZ|nr:Centrosomal protein [Oopsacas minuta]
MPVWKLSCSGNYIDLNKPQVFVGRDDDCDITFKQKGIDIRHSVLNYDQRLGVFRLTDLGSSHGTYVNGESVCEESVPLYLGTRIMFGRNPMVWCVEVGEPSNQTEQMVSHIPSQPHGYQPITHPIHNNIYSHTDLPYTSPRANLMSHSFQTPLPGDMSSPLYRSDTSGGKSYFGDTSGTQEICPYPRNDSFAPGNRGLNSIGYSDSSFCDRIASDREAPTPDPKQSITEGSNSDISTRAKTLYGQPSWWGDGSDAFSTPPSHRKEDKQEIHPNKSTDPLPPFNNSSSTSHNYLNTHYTDDTSLFIQSRPSTAVPIANQIDEEFSKRPPLVRRGSYEIPTDELDSSLTRPVIEPDPPFCSPYSGGRKSEVFVVHFGEEKSDSKKPHEPRAFRNPKQTNKHKPRVKLAFKETEPIETATDLSPDPELKLFTPSSELTPQRPEGSILSERGPDIGEPVTSSTPISMISSDDITSLSLNRLKLEENNDYIISHETHDPIRKGETPLESTESVISQSMIEVSKNIENSLKQAYNKTRLLCELLNKQFGDHIVPLSHHNFPKEFESPLQQERKVITP